MVDPFDIFDIGGTGDHASISSRRITGGAASRNAEITNEMSLRALDEKIEKLTLINMAMWSLLQDKTNLTEEDLLERVKVIDLMDGKEDGRASRTVSKCPKCSRTMSPRHKRCLYCGYEQLVQSAFDKL